MPSLEELLMALNAPNLPNLPAPANPLPMGPITAPNVPQYGGPRQGTDVPTAPYNPAIAQQYQALQGPAPTPPAPLSRGQRIAHAISGLGAGGQGDGAQVLDQLEETERRYEEPTADCKTN